MSNPVVTFSNIIPEPSDPLTVRTSYMMKVFNSVDFFLYSKGDSSSTYVPTDSGSEFYLWYQLGDAIGSILPAPPPKFITPKTWDKLKASPSGFVTPNYSIMPKIVGPSTLMVDNGLSMVHETYMAFWQDSGIWKKLFNWVIDTVNGVVVGPTSPDWFRYGQVGANFGSLYTSIKAKDDTNKENTVETSLPALGTPPTGDWDSTNLVGGGAMYIMLNILGITPGQANPTDNEENRWSIEIKFGDVTMKIADASTMTVNIAGGDAPDGNDTTVNLAEGAAKEGPPQQQHMADKPPLLIGVYSVWNGIVVTSGSQDTIQVAKTAGTYCRKYKAASIQDPVFCGTWFDPKAPANVEVGVIGGGMDVKVGFGNHIDVVAKNCRFEIAYLPRFFTKSMSLDGWLLLEKDSAEITYQYDIYTIWTKNGTDYKFPSVPIITSSSYDGSEDGTHYYYANWNLVTDAKIYQRWAGEVFAYILRTKETRTHGIKNGNGNFNLTWAGGTAGDSGATDWTKYIKTVSVTVGIDGSSGSITVDKYGVAGQDAIADQKIGAVVLGATGGVGTVAGTIFQGLGMGISNAEQSGDSTWTIPLLGLEKKLDDIGLINPPFMDGETLAVAVDYLCRYAGIQYDLSAADPGVFLSASEEINSARFDWKSGTSVKTALDDVLLDVHHTYCVRDGKVFIYKLGDNGLPVMLGPDQSGGYDSKNIVNIDKTPDFENLRNYVVGLAIQKVPDGQGTKIDDVPHFPLIDIRTKVTNPDVPWAKCWVVPYPDATTPAIMAQRVGRMSYGTSTYELTGKLTIPGNADIKPFDQWGDLVIYSVTHTVDLAAKTWTTDLEFMRNAT